jgi:hypothetical protein
VEITPTTHSLDVIATHGTPFRVVFLADGMSLSRPAANKFNKDGPSLVEFYDRRYPQTPDGQFVACYHLDTLLEGRAGGLTLYGGAPSWIVDDATMNLIRFWLDRFAHSTTTESLSNR